MLYVTLFFRHSSKNDFDIFVEIYEFYVIILLFEFFQRSNSILKSCMF